MTIFLNGSIGITPCGEGKFQGMYVSKLGTKSATSLYKLRNLFFLTNYMLECITKYLLISRESLTLTATIEESNPMTSSSC